MEPTVKIRKGYSLSPDAVEAVSEVYSQLFQPGISVVVLFCSSKYDLKILGPEIKTSFGQGVIACTTAGEISQAGYTDGGISGVSIAGPGMKIFSHFIHPIDNYNISRAEETATLVDNEFGLFKKTHPGAKGFGLLLVDGLSCKEEQIAGYLYNALKGLPIVGGSAGDDLKFEETFVYSDGKFYSNAAVFSLIVTDMPFKIFKSQHFVPSAKKMVITKADTEKRIVYEINGKPAAREYARLRGLEINKLTPNVFSRYPVILKIGGKYYVRSIQKVNTDESLTFFCAIDEGLVLTLCEGVDFITTLEKLFLEVRETIQEPLLIIGFECILRRLEVLDSGILNEAAALMSKNNVVGFHSYGEQINGLHVNQTFTGVALGFRDGRHK